MTANDLMNIIRSNTHSLTQDKIEFQIKLPDENRMLQLEVENFRHYGSENKLVFTMKAVE